MMKGEQAVGSRPHGMIRRKYDPEPIHESLVEIQPMKALGQMGFPRRAQLEETVSFK